MPPVRASDRRTPAMFLVPRSVPRAFMSLLAAGALSLPGAPRLSAQAPAAAPPAAGRNPAAALPADADALFTPTYQIQGQPPFLLRTIFRRLAAQNTASRTFSEARTSAIAKRPVTARGALRFSRLSGLSMAYENPLRVLIIDDRGLIERGAGGRERSIAVADRPELGALTDVYLNLLRGNSAKLFSVSDAYFAGDKRGWQLGLVPKDPDLAKRVGRAVISGRTREVQRIETTAGNGDTRRIDLGRLTTNKPFSPEEQKAFFRE